MRIAVLAVVLLALSVGCQSSSTAPAPTSTPSAATAPHAPRLATAAPAAPKTFNPLPVTDPAAATPRGGASVHQAGRGGATGAGDVRAAMGDRHAPGEADRHGTVPDGQVRTGTVLPVSPEPELLDAGRRAED